VVKNIKKFKRGVLNGFIPSAFADSGATPHIRAKTDQANSAFITIGQQSNKAFHMPNGAVEAASTIDKLHHPLRLLEKDAHIMPSIKHNLLLSISKFVNENYITMLIKDKVNIYNANNMFITTTQATILSRWRCPQTKL
jgi:hypothetical protein